MLMMMMMMMRTMMMMMMMMMYMNTDCYDQVRILLHIVSEHTSEENNFIQVSFWNVPFIFGKLGRQIFSH